MFGPDEDPFADLYPSNAGVRRPPTGAPPVLRGEPKPPEDPKRGSLPQGMEFGPDNMPRVIPGLDPAYVKPPKPPLGEGEAKVREAEQKAMFHAGNMTVNANLMAGALVKDPGQSKPTWTQKGWGLLGQDVRNSNLPAQRQVIEDSQRQITEAILNLNTGAAFSPAQLEGTMQSYFPQIGDSEAAVAAKRVRLRGAMLLARGAAGAAAPKIDEAMAALGLDADIDPRTATNGTESTNPEFDNDPRNQAGYVDPETGALHIGTIVGGGVRDPEQQARVDARLEKGGNIGDVVAGATNAATFGLSDELSAGGDALLGSLAGKGSFGTLYDKNIGVEREFLERSRERSPWLYGGGQVLGGAALPIGTTIRGVKGLSALGAAQGGAYGFGESQGNALERLPGAVGGAALGGATGAVLSLAAPYLGRAVEPILRPRGRAPETMRLLRDENITPRGSLIDGRADRAASLEAYGGSGPIIRAADKQTMQEIEGRVGELSGGGQAYSESMTAGEAIQGAGARYIKTSGAMAKRIYDRARGLAGDARIQPAKSIQAVDDRLAALSENPSSNQGEIKFFTDLRNDLLQNGGKTIEGAKQLRQSIRGTINKDNLTATQAEVEARKILDALREDAADSLPNGAGRAFAVADRFYAERMADIEVLADKFVGKANDPMSGERAFAKFRSMASPRSGEGRKLAAVWRNLEPDEQRNLAATLVERLGRENDGKTSKFSAAKFISQVETGLSPSARATMFGPSGARSIENLIQISRNVTGVQKRLNNSSTTRTAANDIARAIVPSSGLGALAGAGSQSVATGATVAGLTITAALAARITRSLSARALMSPKLTRWLADAPSAQSAAQLRDHTAKLGNIMTREPALAAEIAPLHRWMNEQIATRAAASEPKGERNGR